MCTLLGYLVLVSSAVNFLDFKGDSHHEKFHESKFMLVRFIVYLFHNHNRLSMIASFLLNQSKNLSFQRVIEEALHNIFDQTQ